METGVGSEPVERWTRRPAPSTAVPTGSVRPLIISPLPPHEQGERGSDKDEQCPHADQRGIEESVGCVEPTGFPNRPGRQLEPHWLRHTIAVRI